MLDRADSPWYPTMRIYRQTRSGDWTAVFDQVRRELESLARMKTGATEARSKLPPRTIPPKTFVKQYGERRTGTNFVRALLCANYHVEVLMHIFGDKHSAPAPFDEYWREAQSDPMPARAFAWRATFSVPAATTNALDPLQVEDVTEMADGIANAFAIPSAISVTSSTCSGSSALVVAAGTENVARQAKARAGIGSLWASRQYSSKGAGAECLSPKMCISTST